MRKYTPAGWAIDRISMGQIWEGGGFGAAIQDTLSTFAGGAYKNALDSFFTYFGTGSAHDTRDALLTTQPGLLSLTGEKIYGLADGARAAGMGTPTLVVYSNDFSTSEGVVSNIDVNGAKPDGTFDISKPVNQFANLALQAGAFQRANEKDGQVGTILFNPDALGAMAKNLIGNGVSINIDPNETGAIYVNATATHPKTAIDFSRILSDAVARVYAQKSIDSGLAQAVYFPAEMPDPTKISNGIAPIAFAGDISDYLAAQAWILRQFAPKDTLSVVTNLWAGNWSTLNLKAVTYDADAASTRAAEAFRTLGWDKAVGYLDFLTFDKYERDETSGGVLGVGAFDFNGVAWSRALDFINGVTAKIMPAEKQAIMLWQIPASGLPADDPADAAMLAQGGGTGGDQPHFGLTDSYFFGDGKLAAKGLAPAIASLPVAAVESGADRLSPGTTYGQVVTGANAGWHPATGLIDPATGTSSAQLDKVFAILWGGGNTSAPISYKGSQWTSLGDGSVAPTSGGALDVKNERGTAVLGIVKEIAAYKASVGDGTSLTPAGESNYLQAADLAATASMVMKAASSAPVTVDVEDNGIDPVSFGYFDIDPVSLTVAAPAGGAVKVGDAGFASAALAIARTNGLIADVGYKGTGHFQIVLDPAKTYGFLILNDNGNSVLTSFRTANADGAFHVAAFESAAQTDRIGFEDRSGIAADHDYNDLVVGLVGAAFQAASAV